LANKDYKIEIQKVFSQVKGGKFTVDFKFIDEVPKEIRRGQTLQIRLALSSETQALLVARGGFYQQSGGNWAFKLNDGGTIAYRVDISLGRQNPDYYEVLSGLKAGDRIITSSYDNYLTTQELILKASK
jgi:HlyD family secretion protein